MISVTRLLVYVFQFGPFTTMKLCPIPYIILPKNVQNVAKYYQSLSKWRNFAKSGHTANDIKIGNVSKIF